MPGQVQHTRDSLRAAVAAAAGAGIGGVMLFGVPATRDATGTCATDPAGVLATAVRDAVAEVGDALVVQADLCLDEFTDHGHCGVLADDGRVDNDATLVRYGEMAVVLADAGAHLLGLSGMMDGQVAAVRAALDAAGRTDTAAAGVRRQVRLRVLRAVPRGRRVHARRRPALLPARPGQPPRGSARGAAGHRRGRRRGDGQARRVLPRRAGRRRGRVDRFRCGRTRSPASTRWSRRRPRTAGSTAGAS